MTTAKQTGKARCADLGEMLDLRGRVARSQAMQMSRMAPSQSERTGMDNERQAPGREFRRGIDCLERRCNISTDFPPGRVGSFIMRAAMKYVGEED